MWSAPPRLAPASTRWPPHDLRRTRARLCHLVRLTAGGSAFSFYSVDLYSSTQGCPVIAMANRCNELSRREIRAKSHRNDIFWRRPFSDKNGAPDPPPQNGGCHRAAPSSLS